MLEGHLLVTKSSISLPVLKMDFLKRIFPESMFWGRRLVTNSSILLPEGVPKASIWGTSVYSNPFTDILVTKSMILFPEGVPNTSMWGNSV